MVKMKTGPWALELITGAFRADSRKAVVLAAHIYGPVDTNYDGYRFRLKSMGMTTL